MGELSQKLVFFKKGDHMRRVFKIPPNLRQAEVRDFIIKY